MNSSPPLSNSLILVTGPSRSGKSEWAEHLAQQSGHPILYIATATYSPEDAEWQLRIQRHRDRRPPTWTVWEIPVALAPALQSAPSQTCVLIDSLGTWLANLLEQSEEQWQQTEAEFLKVLQARPHPIIVVAEEVGWGVVPAYPLGRQFRDRLGTLTRRLGGMADEVYLVTAGFALDLKQWGQAVPKGVDSIN